MYYKEEIVEEIQNRNDIVDVVGSYVQLKRQGSNFFGLCPFHNEKSPSFSVTPSKQMFYCFGCHKGGNVFTFISEMENLSFQESIQFLAAKSGIDLPEEEYTEQSRRERSQKEAVLAINKDAANYFYYLLHNEMGKNGLEYFKSRQLSDETMKHFALGYSTMYSDDLIKYLRKKGYRDEDIRESGLATFNEKYGLGDKFMNRVMFPIQNVHGKVIGFGGRVLGDGKPKYLNSPETIVFNKSKNLYGMNFVRTSRKNRIILCEGYMDVIAMHQAGFTEAAASLGTAFTEGQAFLLKRYTNDVYLAYDSDGAGTDAALRAIGMLRNAGIAAKVINMKPYKDPDEFIKNLGTEEFQKRIENAENGFMFEVRVLEKDYHLQDPDSITRFQIELAKKLGVFDDELMRENYLSFVCKEYKIDEGVMHREVAKYAGASSYTPKQVKSGVTKMTVEDGAMKTQRLLLTWLVEEPKIYQKSRQYISLDDFTEDLYRIVAEKLFEQLQNDKINPALILNMFEDVEDQQKAAEVFNTKLDAIDNAEDKQIAFKDIIIQLKQNSLDRMSKSIGADKEALKKVVEGKKALEELKRLNNLFD